MVVGPVAVQRSVDAVLRAQAHGVLPKLPRPAIMFSQLKLDTSLCDTFLTTGGGGLLSHMFIIQNYNV